MTGKGNGFKLGVMIVVLAVLASGPAVAGCRPKAPLLVLTAPWAAGEFSRLDMFNGATGERLGGWDLGVERPATGDGYVLSSWTNVPGLFEHSDVTVSAAGLLPSLLQYEAEVGPAKTRYLLRGVYGEEDVTVSFTKDGADQPGASVKLPEPPYFENEQAPFVLRALPLAEGFSAALTIIVAKNVSKAQISVTVKGTESVTVPVGTFDCWVVELVGVGQTAWIAVDAPHQLVQYSSTSQSGAIISKLVEYRSGK